MLNREAIQRIKSYTDSFRITISNRHIYAILLTIRARLLTQEQKKGQRVSSFAYQVLPCVELIEVPLNECACTPQSGCTALRTKYPLPTTLVGASKHLFRVSGLDGTLSFQETTFQEKKYKNGNRFTKFNPDFFVRDGYLFITVTKKIETVTVEGLFANPIEADTFASACSQPDPCRSYLDYIFPYEEDLMDGLVDLTIAEVDKVMGIKRVVEATEAGLQVKGNG